MCDRESPVFGTPKLWHCSHYLSSPLARTLTITLNPDNFLWCVLQANVALQTHCIRRLSSPCSSLQTSLSQPSASASATTGMAIVAVASRDIHQMIFTTGVTVLRVSAVLPQPHNGAGWSSSAASSADVVGSPSCMVSEHIGTACLASLAHFCARCRLARRK